MDIIADNRQGNIGLLADMREPWDITQGYIESDSIVLCPTCRQYETMELAFGGNGISEYRCSHCGAQIRYEDDEEEA